MDTDSTQYRTATDDSDAGLDLPPKILLVDDSETVRTILGRALQIEFPIIEARDGEAAWRQLLADKGIEVVITDLSMPGVDGYELIRRMRASDTPRVANTPVIVITGIEETDAKARAFKLGANDFINKDVDYVEMRARVAAHQKLVRTIRELEKSRCVLAEQAYTDPLTRLANRRAFFDQAEKCLCSMRRHHEDLAVIMIDIDHFKRTNDDYGHQVGDHVLERVAGALQRMVRAEDILARIGGEEFALALPYTGELAALVLAERLRREIRQTPLDFVDTDFSVTISQGVAVYDPERGDTLDDLLARADASLYVAKQQGRDRVCASSAGAGAAVPGSRRVGVDEALRLIALAKPEAVNNELPALIEAVVPLLELASRRPEAAAALQRLQSLLSGDEKNAG